MRVLVAYATSDCATRGLAEVVGGCLLRARLDAQVLPAQVVGDLRAYDAVVLGSGIAVSRWPRSATELVRRHSGVLAARPTWLYTSRPVDLAPFRTGDRAFDPTATSDGVRMLGALVGARDHAVLRARSDEVLRWADRIASELSWSQEDAVARAS